MDTGLAGSSPPGSDPGPSPFQADSDPVSILQLAISQPSTTPLLALLGLTASSLARSPTLPFSSFLVSDKLVLLAKRANLFLLGEEPPLRRATLATVGALLATGFVPPAQGPMRNPFRRAVQPVGVVVGASNAGLPTSAASGVEPAGEEGEGTEPGAVSEIGGTGGGGVGVATHPPTPTPGWREGLTGAQVAPPEDLVQSLLRVFPGQPRGQIISALQRSQERRAVDVGAGAAEELMSARR